MIPVPRAVLLDRDGTVNVKAPEGDYITGPERVELLPGAAQAIATLNRAGVPVAIVSNQRGIALGRMSEADLSAVNLRLAELLAEQHARIDLFFHCPHQRGVCACRKPGTLMLERARDALGLRSLSDAVMIGDAPSDILAGQAAGARTILLSPGGEAGTSSATPDARAPSLLVAVRDVLALD